MIEVHSILAHACNCNIHLAWIVPIAGDAEHAPAHHPLLSGSGMKLTTEASLAVVGSRCQVAGLIDLCCAIREFPVYVNRMVH